MMRSMAVALILLLVIAVIVVNRYRDTIALEVANAALGDTAVTVTDVSVRSIRADFVHFDEIILELESGTTVLIEGVSLPVKLRSFAGSTLHIDRVTVLPDDTDTSQPQLGAALRSYLDAPGTMPGGTVAVDELLLPDLPRISDVAWYADELNPTLRAGIGDFDLFLSVTPDGADDYRASLRALLQDDTEAMMVAFRIDQADAGYALHGKAALQLESLLPVFHAIGAVPEDVTQLVSKVSGTFETRIDDELPVSVKTQLEMQSAIQVDYQASEDSPVHIAVTDLQPVEATFEYPSFNWAAAVEGATLIVSGAGIDSLPVTFAAGRCRSGIHCSAAVRVNLQQVGFGAVSIGKLALAAESVQLTSVDGDWQARSDNARVTMKNTTVAGQQLVAPNATVEFAASNDQLSATVRFSTPEGGFSGRAELRHNLTRGTGELRLRDTALDFDILNLAEAVADWPYDFDVASGYWRIDADVNWAVTDAGFAYTGTTTHTLDWLAGKYGDIGFVGLNSEIEVTLDWQADPAMSAAEFEVALVDIGFPIEEMHGRFTADISALAADVESVSMKVLGGSVSVDPFRYEHAADINQLMLRAREIQLPLMVGLADLDAVEISGSVSGDIPVTLKNHKVVIDKGLLRNDPPGGAIRYGAGVVDDQSQLGVVTRALRNFEFDVLTSEVDYTDTGDLKLQMRLTGTNPDVDPDQPIVLNLGVENNVPQMLRSLQATRSIEDVLQKRLGN
jgi:hypothetical protein